MILFILYIAQNDSSVSMSPGYVGLSRHVLGLSGISLLLRVVSHQRAHDGITWNVNNDDGEAPRLLLNEWKVGIAKSLYYEKAFDSKGQKYPFEDDDAQKKNGLGT